MKSEPVLLDGVERKVAAGERLSVEEGTALFGCRDLLRVGRLANQVRERRSGDVTYYIRNRHINYSNLCVSRCKFCAFSRSEQDPGAYTMDLEEIAARAKEAHALGATEVHIVGGLHPQLPLDYYLEMLRTVRRAAPGVHIQALTAVEVAHLAQLSGRSVTEVLERLVQAGLGSLPGGGAEVFSPRIRRLLCPVKLPGGGWLEVMRTVHQMGLHSNATMLYGHIESAQEKAEHLAALRQLQDETGGFLSFIPLLFHSEHTSLDQIAPTTGVEDLMTIAVSRLMLDNFPHIKAFWIMLGPKLAQVAQWFGADDLDGTVVEERITHEAGATTPQGLTVTEIESLIREAGRRPVERDTLYRPVVRQAAVLPT